MFSPSDVYTPESVAITPTRTGSPVAGVPPVVPWVEGVGLAAAVGVLDDPPDAAAVVGVGVLSAVSVVSEDEPPHALSNKLPSTPPPIVCKAARRVS
ncbi:hypothetical protein [Sphaerobacter sp.]|uniref:hypothetical protein n=1 Tax=Sphaerobacter sp. TaxID=2099654 RepID=UPI0025FA2BE1|nr:hypothetical protein [Sphaerobacter sp.]